MHEKVQIKAPKATTDFIDSHDLALPTTLNISEMDTCEYLRHMYIQVCKQESHKRIRSIA